MPPSCDDRTEDRATKSTARTELRYLLTINLSIHGSATVFEMIDLLEYQGFVIPGRASKTVTDALRWEMRRGRVRRIRRGVYGPGQMPRSTEHYIHKRAIALREEADRRIGRDETTFWDSTVA